MSKTDTSAEAIQRDADYWAEWAKDVRENNGSVADAENMEAMNARLLTLAAERDALRAQLSQARNAALEEAVEAIGARCWSIAGNHYSRSYNAGVTDSIAAIRALKKGGDA